MVLSGLEGKMARSKKNFDFKISADKLKDLYQKGYRVNREFLKNNPNLFPYSTSTIENYFGTWNNFVTFAGVPPLITFNTPLDKMLNYRRACLKHNRFLSFYELEREEGIPATQYKLLFGSNKPFAHLKGELPQYLLAEENIFKAWLDLNFKDNSEVHLKKRNNKAKEYLSKKITYEELDQYYDLFYTKSNKNLDLVAQWQDLISKGFPYPKLSDYQWDGRFLNLVKDNDLVYKPRENNSLLCNVFYPQIFDHLLAIFSDTPRLIANRVKYADRITSGSLLTGLKLLSKETRTNFSPLITKITLNKLSKGRPCNILDYSMGFGGRLLGTLASDVKHTYFGIDPWMANINSAKELLKAIDRSLPGSSERCYTYNCGSEDYISDLENSIDIAFSSPPYFDYEKYVTEETQSYFKYPVYSDWLEKYWRITVINIKYYLKEEGIFALNIKNIKKYPLEEDMRKIMEEEGFVLVDTLKYPLFGRMQNFSKIKEEPIFIFTKRS